jgi:hypothetical protein
MTTFLINYADRSYYRAQELNIKSALAVGRFDRAIPMGRQHIDARFLHQNRYILDQPHGAGYWLWKPYIILKLMREEMQDDDVLFYCDSGCYFIRSIAPITELCRRQPLDKSIVLFALCPGRPNRVYTKRDCFHYMNLDSPRFADAAHLLGTFFLCQKTPFASDFVEEWLSYAQDARIITDAPNVCGLPNYREFIVHRHDQSILSLLGKKYEIATVPDISQHGNDYRPREIPQIIQHTRWSE